MGEAEDLMNKCCLSKCRGHALEAENKQQAEFLSLAKEQMDAYQAENKQLKETVKAGGECCRQLQERINRLEYALKGK